MRKEDTQEYLSDEALEALIRETEEGPMIKAPEYLEENILHKIEQQQKVIVYKEKVSAKRKLLTYSMKVMAAAALGQIMSYRFAILLLAVIELTAMFLLICLPAKENRPVYEAVRNAE